MPKLVFISPEGEQTVVDAAADGTLMQAATNAMIKGVIAECGGCLSCATCHVYIDEAWYPRLPPKDELEQEMLAMAAEPGPTSRLSCQVRVTADLDGMVVRVPATQG